MGPIPTSGSRFADYYKNNITINNKTNPESKITSEPHTMYFRFRNFPIYKLTRGFIKDIYILTNSLPDFEKYALASQLRRASTSILLNLAEGSMRGSDSEFHHFIMYSIASLAEVVSILDVCMDQNYITPSVHDDFMLKCEDIEKQLFSFSTKLKPK